MPWRWRDGGIKVEWKKQRDQDKNLLPEDRMEVLLLPVIGGFGQAGCAYAQATLVSCSAAWGKSTPGITSEDSMRVTDWR